VKTLGHDGAVDHWQLGVLIYDMLAGYGPFFYDGIEQMELFRSIVEDDIPNIDGKVSRQALDLIQGLLQKDPSCRLGSLARGEKDILHHDWFRDVSLIQLQNRQLPAPWTPANKTKDPFDTSNFDDWSDLDDITLDKGPPLSNKQKKLFENF